MKQDFITLAPIVVDDVQYMLYVGTQSRKWYAAKRIGQYQVDPKNNTPILPLYQNEPQLLSEITFNKYFK